MSLSTDKTVEGTAPSSQKWYVAVLITIIVVLLLSFLRVWVFNSFANQPPSDGSVGASTSTAGAPVHNASSPSASNLDGGPPFVLNTHSAVLVPDPSVTVDSAIGLGTPAPILDHIWSIIRTAEKTKNVAYLTHAFVFADEPLYLKLKADIESGNAIVYPVLTNVHGPYFNSGVYLLQFDSTANGVTRHYKVELGFDLDRNDWAVVDYLPS